MSTHIGLDLKYEQPTTVSTSVKMQAATASTQPADTIATRALQTDETDRPSANPSNVQFAPITTAASNPDTPASGVESSPSSSGFSKSSRNALIATTTVGGTLVLLLLIYAFWRRRKGATYAEIVRFRPHSGTVMLRPHPADPKMTALPPIYCETRYSIRSSKHTSQYPSSTSHRHPPGVPPKVADSFHKQNPWIQSQWQTSGPNTPPVPPAKDGTLPRHPLTQVTTCHAPATPATTKPPTPAPAKKPAPTISVREAPDPTTPRPATATSPSELYYLNLTPTSTNFTHQDPPSPSSTAPSTSASHDPAARWSWTNSQAPPTPRLLPPNRHGRDSLPYIEDFDDEEAAAGGGGGVDWRSMSGSMRPGGLRVPGKVVVGGGGGGGGGKGGGGKGLRGMLRPFGGGEAGGR